MNFLIAFLTAVLCYILLYLFLRRRQAAKEALRQRMARLENTGGMDSRGNNDDESRAESAAFRFVRGIAKQLRKIHNSADLDFRMQQADWPLLGSEFLVIIFSIGLLLGTILFLLTLQLLNLFLGISAGVLFGLIYLKQSIKRRRQKFVNQLGDCLMMVANALRAGFSFMQAMELVSREMDAPLGSEFRKVIGEMNVGASLETALSNMSKRMESSDFDLVVTAVLIQRQVGGNLSQILDTISDTIRERIRMKAEILTLTAQGRFSGMILLALPFVVCGFIMITNPGYLQPMLSSTAGQIALFVGLILEFIGYLIIKRIVNIDCA
ncbi:MAG: type II secretion system F family protein [Selenomonadaceae bacterium]|nr:type II secretion system F family protein [Selenomonadaceae bacterium]